MRIVRSHPWITVFAVLSGLRICLLFLGHSQLVQEHWRVPAIGSGGDWIWFSVMLGISVVVPVWVRPRVVLPVLGKGSLILFLILMAVLMPQQLKKNYIHILTAFPFSVGDVGSYVLEVFFFKTPYAALHLVFLGVGWWAARRVGDDRIYLSCWGLSVAILMAALISDYALIITRTELWVLSVLLCMAVVQTLFKGQWGSENHAVWFIILSGVSGVCLFGGDTSLESLLFCGSYLILAACFSLCLGRMVCGHMRPKLLFGLFWGVVFFVALNRGYPAGPNFRHIFIHGLFVGRYLAENLLLVLVLFVGARRLGRRGMILFGISSVFLLVATYVDVNYFIRTGCRLSGFMLEMGGGTGLAVKMVSEYLTFSFFAVFFVLCGVALVGPALALCAGDATHGKSERSIVAVALFFLVGGAIWCSPDAFVASFPRNIISDTSFFRNLRSPMIKQKELLENFATAGVPLNERGSAENVVPDKPKNLILVVLESMPNIHLSLFGGRDETQPMLSTYTNRMVRYPNLYCSWPSSNHARTTIWNGLYPIRPHLSVVNPRIGRSSLTELLKGAGYYNAFFYSSDRNYTRLNDYLGHRGLDLIADSQVLGKGIDEDLRVSWGVQESVTLDAMKKFLSARAKQDEPFSLTYIPACPHMPYDTHDERFGVFSEGKGAVDGNYTGAYKNQLLYMDWILASLVEHLEDCGLLEKSVVVFVNDHGERIHSKVEGGLGHGWFCDPVMANIPLMVMSAEEKAGGFNYAYGSQVDVLPTILDYLHLVPPEDMPMQGMSLKNGASDGRRIYLGSYRDFAVIENRIFFYIPQGDLSKGMVFKMSNREGKSFFALQKEPLSAELWEQLGSDYSSFMRCQESLIRHYDEYDW